MQDNDAEDLSGDPAAPPPVAIVADDVLCTGCGYDLRRLAEDMNCPECGRAVRESLQGHLLAGADPTWLRRIARGGGLLAWGWVLIASALVLFIGVFMFTMFIGIVGGLGPVGIVLAGLFLVLPLALLIGLVLSAIGAILITIQEPRESLRETPLSSRRLARIGLIGAIIAYLSMAPVGAVFGITAAAQFALFLLGGAVLVLITVGMVSMLRLLAALVARVPDPKRAKLADSMASFFAWALPAATVPIVALNIVGNATGRIESLLLVLGLAGCLSIILWIVIVIRGVYLAVLLFHARRMFRDALSEAAQRDVTVNREPANPATSTDPSPRSS